MSEGSDRRSKIVRCPDCAAVVNADSPFCPTCGAHIDLGSITVSVSGTDASEVEAVSRALVEDAFVHRRADQMARRASERDLRNPWFSGLFYLVALVIIIGLLLTIGRQLPPWTLAFIVVGAVLLLSVVGAFQLRQDDRLSEKRFLSLMQIVLERLPSLIRPTSRDDG